MAKFRKKPVVVDVVEYNGLNVEEIKSFVGDKCEIEIHDGAWKAGAGPVVAEVIIHTLEGDMHVSKGDYIIKGVQGEFYPCKPDIFHETYEEVSNNVMENPIPKSKGPIDLWTLDGLKEYRKILDDAEREKARRDIAATLLTGSMAGRDSLYINRFKETAAAALEAAEELMRQAENYHKELRHVLNS